MTRGYASARIWAQAVATAGTIDGGAVAGALHSVTFDVFGIEASFDEKGNMQGPLGEAALWIWQERRPVPLDPDAPAAAKSGSGAPHVFRSKIN